MTTSVQAYFSSRRPKITKMAGKGAGMLLRIVILGGISFVILYPLLTRVLTSFMSMSDLYDNSVRYYPKSPTFQNYINAWNFLDVPKLAFTTFFYPFLISFVQMAAATVVSYGFARYEFPMKKLLFAVIIGGMVIPPDLLLVPLYLDFKFFDFHLDFGLLHTFFGIDGMEKGLIELVTGNSIDLLNTPLPFLILGITCTGLKNGLYLFIMMQYFRGLPKELEEAAYVDGAGSVKAFVRVFLPSAVQIMITVFLFSFVWQYMDTIFVSVFAQDVPILSTELSRLLSNSGAAESGFSNLSMFSLMRNASMLFLILPLLIIYIVCQRYFTESIERSGLVG